MVEPASPRLQITKKVLVVEDDAATRRSLVELLESDGCVVDTAADGEVAADYLARADYDVVLLDLALPRVGGTEIMEHIACTRPQTLARTIVVTGSDLTGVRRHFPELGETLAKPVTVAGLLTAVDRIRGHA